jgi:hypothetical protein
LNEATSSSFVIASEGVNRPVPVMAEVARKRMSRQIFARRLAQGRRKRKKLRARSRHCRAGP